MVDNCRYRSVCVYISPRCTCFPTSLHLSLEPFGLTRFQADRILYQFVPFTLISSIYPFTTRTINTMATLQERFEAAAEELKTLTRRPTDDEFLEIYALFKQATIGDNNTSKPGMLDLKGKAKWESWNKLKGESKEDCQQKYIAKVAELVGKYRD